MDAASGGAAVWWWIGIVLLFVAIAPTVVWLAHRLLTVVREINAYAEDIRIHGVAVTANLDPVPALGETRDLVKQVSAGLDDYAAAAGRLL